MKGSTNPTRNHMKNELPFALPMIPVARPNVVKMISASTG
jgi:hypothetical protein